MQRFRDLGMIFKFKFFRTITKGGLMNIKYSSGMTLVELLITIAVACVLLGLAVPSFTSLLEAQKVEATSRKLSTDLEALHARALKENDTLYFSFNTGTNWCYGIDDTATCDCTVSDDCQISGVTKVVSASDYDNVSLGASGFSGNGFSVDGLRGTLSDSGYFDVTLNSRTITVKLTPIGLVGTCSSTEVGYEAC